MPLVVQTMENKPQTKLDKMDTVDSAVYVFTFMTKLSILLLTQNISIYHIEHIKMLVYQSL